MQPPDPYSVRGPHGTTPFVVIVEHEQSVARIPLNRRSTFLFWATSPIEARDYALARCGVVSKIQVLAAPPDHHIGRSRCVIHANEELEGMDSQHLQARIDELEGIFVCWMCRALVVPEDDDNDCPLCTNRVGRVHDEFGP